MIRTILDFCLRQPVIVLVLTGAIIAYGWLSAQQVPIDAIPDIGENQVIVLTSWPGRSPRDVEDQITNPLSVGLRAVPHAKNVRGRSMFGYSFVQVTFADDVDFYWARSRVAEQLTTVANRLPPGVTPTLGPDATGLGQVLYYVLKPPRNVSPEQPMNLAQLRSMQDYVVRYALESVEGVSEVASVGGYVQQYQIEVDPDLLRYHRIPLSLVMEKVRKANEDVGAKTLESGGMELLVRSKGFLKTIQHLEQTEIITRRGASVRLHQIARVQRGPELRRGALDLNGDEAVGGIVVMRFGENPREVIDRVKAKMAVLEPALGGAKLEVIYDRTDLINETVETLSTALVQEIVITVIVIVLFLLHFRSSLIVAITLPLAVLMAFIAMNQFGVDANIMSLAGIAIAIGTMVDVGIVVSENVYRQLAEWEQSGSPGGQKQRRTVILEAACEVAPAVVTAVATTVISFIPVFFLTGRDHKLFAPLAWTKTFALIASLLVALLLVPLLCRLFLHSSTWHRGRSMRAALAMGLVLSLTCWLFWGKHVASWVPRGLPAVTVLSGIAGTVLGYLLTQERVRPMENNPVSRVIVFAYVPTLRFFLRNKLIFLCAPTLIVILGLGAWFGLPNVLKPVEKGAQKLGTDLNRVPGYVSAKHTFTGLEDTDWIGLDEGSWFYMPVLYPGASFSQAMQVLQTQDVLIREIPEVKNVLGKIGRAESALDPAPAAMIETYVMLKPKSQWRPGVTEKTIWNEITRRATLPGVTPASELQPIEGRVVMLQSGIKASMAVRIYGDNLQDLEKAARSVARHLKQNVPQVDAKTVNPDVVLGKPYLEFTVDREKAARYQMDVKMVNQIIEMAIGGMNVTTTVEGRERYPVRVRYPRQYRERIDELNRLPVVTHSGAVVPLEELAKIETSFGPGVIASENARLVAHVSFAPQDKMGALETAQAAERSLRDAHRNGKLDLPTGYEIQIVGSFQNQIEANERLTWLLPVVVVVILFLIWLQFRNLPITLCVFSAIPVAFGGGMILLGILEVKMNTAVWVGFIALFGIAVDDGIVMATYLSQLFNKRTMHTVEEIQSATVEAGLMRIRPCLMTTFTTLAALVPVLLSTGRGSDVARSMALPVFGGMTVELITLFVVPVLWCGYNEIRLKLGLRSESNEPTSEPSSLGNQASTTSS